MIGNVWSPKWVNWLRTTVRGAGFGLDWYGTRQWYLTASDAELQADRITACGSLPEGELSERLGNYPYMLVPTGTSDERDDRGEIGSLSLPSRIIFCVATSHTPVIVMGSENSPGARFVRRFAVDEDHVVPDDELDAVDRPGVRGRDLGRDLRLTEDDLLVDRLGDLDRESAPAGRVLCEEDRTGSRQSHRDQERGPTSTAG